MFLLTFVFWLLYFSIHKLYQNSSKHINNYSQLLEWKINSVILISDVDFFNNFVSRLCLCKNPFSAMGVNLATDLHYFSATTRISFTC